MNRREPRCIANFGLCDRKFEAVATGQANCLQFEEHLTQDVCNAAWSLPASSIDDPFAENGRINQRVAPEFIREHRMGVAYRTQRIVGNEAALLCVAAVKPWLS